jgi:hypothetical protein
MIQDRVQYGLGIRGDELPGPPARNNTQLDSEFNIGTGLTLKEEERLNMKMTCLLCCCAVYSRRSLQTSQRCSLPPSSGR